MVRDPVVSGIAYCAKVMDECLLKGIPSEYADGTRKISRGAVLKDVFTVQGAASSANPHMTSFVNPLFLVDKHSRSLACASEGNLGNRIH